MANNPMGVQVLYGGTTPQASAVNSNSMIGIVSVAPTGPVNEIVPIRSAADASIFGIDHKDNLLRNAIKHIQAQANTIIYAINVFDDGNNTDVVTGTQIITNGQLKLHRLFVSDLEIQTLGGSPVTLAEGTDYTYNPTTQVVTILTNTTYPDGTSLSIEYVALTATPSAITNAQIIGTNTAGVRTGLQLLEMVEQLYGAPPKVVISPLFSEREPISAELIAKAEKLHGFTILDVTPTATVNEVIKGRNGTSTTVLNIGTRSERAIIAYPAMVAYDAFTDSEYVTPYSSFLAGANALQMAKVGGLGLFLTNAPLRGFIKPNTLITFSSDGDITAENNVLTNAGVVTYRPGYYAWGDRNASYPTNETPTSFGIVIRNMGILKDELVKNTIGEVGKSLDAPRISYIESLAQGVVNQFVANKGFLPGSVVSYNSSDNPNTDLAQGKIVFRVTLVPSIGIGLVTYITYLDTSNLTQIIGGA